MISLDREKYIRYGEKPSILTNHSYAFVCFLRKYQKAKLLKPLYRLLLKGKQRRYGLEIGYHTKIGAGFYMGHAYGITINGAAVLGENVSVHKGVTIGQENRGARKGAPTIGNDVWIGINSTVVGNITVGNDVLIAPNSFVNRDVPDHSIVYGNPCVIRTYTDRICTEGYL